MTSLSELIFYSVISAAILLCVLGLWLTAIVPGIDRWSKRFFLQYFSVFLLCCLLGFFDMAVAWHSFSNKAFYFYTILECVVLALPLPMVTVYLLHCCGENPRRSRLLRAVFVLLAVYDLVLVSAVFVEGYISVAPDGNMTYGPLYPLVLLPPIAIMLLNLAGTIRRRKQISRKTFLSFLIAILPITVALSIQLFMEVIPLIDICYILSALIMYGFALSDQIERDRQNQREILRQRLEMMCGGSLAIRSGDGTGTVVTIFIPDSAAP